MNDLIIPSQLSKRFPRLEAIIKQAQGLFDSIKSFEDLERHFLKGNGLSPNTYRSYLTAIKQFYEYTEGLNPLTMPTGRHRELLRPPGKDCRPKYSLSENQGTQEVLRRCRENHPHLHQSLLDNDRNLTRKAEQDKTGEPDEKGSPEA